MLGHAYRRNQMLIYLATWHNAKDIASEFNIGPTNVRDIMRRMAKQGLIESRAVKYKRGVKASVEYRRTAKGTPIVYEAPRVIEYRHPWEALGEDWRPDWKSDARYIPTPTKNQTFKI